MRYFVFFAIQGQIVVYYSTATRGSTVVRKQSQA